MLDRAELFAQYHAAIVSACDPAVVEADASWSDPALFCVLRQQSAVVLTAWNPGFLRLSPEVNERRGAQLHTRLKLLGYEVWAADGAAPDGTSHEPGFLVWGMPTEQGCEIASEFGQFAIFAYTLAGERSIIACEEHLSGR